MGETKVAKGEQESKFWYIGLPKLYSNTVHFSPFCPHFPFWLKILPVHWLLIVTLLEAPGEIFPGWGPLYGIAGFGTPPDPGLLQPLSNGKRGTQEEERKSRSAPVHDSGKVADGRVISRCPSILHSRSAELTRAVTAVGVRDYRIHGVVALVLDCKLRGRE